MGSGRHALKAWTVAVLFAGGIVPAPVDGTAEPAEIGFYTQLGNQETLTEADTTATANGVKIDAPVLSSSLRINKNWLDEKFGAWSSREPFDMDEGGSIVLPGEDVEFTPLTIGEAPMFTMGSGDSIRFEQRPMWLSVHPEGNGHVRLEMEDGNSAGQQVYVSKQWLYSQGMHRPVAVHESGDSIEVTASSDGLGYFIHVAHFSWVVLSPADIDVKGYENGVFAPHVGQIIWNATTGRLHINVTSRLSTYELWVERDWIDLHIQRPSSRIFGWTVDMNHDIQYYVITLQPTETPTTLVFLPFQPFADWVQFSAGDPSTLYAFDDPLYWSPTLCSNRTLTLNTELPTDKNNHTAVVGLNKSFLMDLNITKPWVSNATGAFPGAVFGSGVLQFPLGAGDTQSIIAHDPLAEISLLQEGACATTLGPSDHVYNYPDDVGAGSTAALYVANGLFCWDWRLAPGERIGTGCAGCPDLAFYGIRGSVSDPIDPEIGCHWGAVSTEGVSNVEGSAACYWPLTNNYGYIIPDTIRHALFADAMGKTAFEMQYSGAASWGNCGTGGDPDGQGDVGPWVAIIVVLLIKAAVDALEECTERWATKGLQWAFGNHDIPVDNRISVEMLSQVGGAMSIEVNDVNDGRLDTWWFVEEQFNVPPPDFTGTQLVQWVNQGFSSATLYYDADISTVYDTGAESSGLVTVWHADGDFLGQTNGATQFESTTPVYLNWEAPDHWCMPGFIVNSLVDGVWHSLGLGNGPDVPCINLKPDDSYDPTPPWQFNVTSTTLSSTDIVAWSETVSLADIQAANNSLVKAMVRKVVSNQAFIEGIQNVTSEGPDGGGTVCSPPNEPYVSMMRAVVDGYSVTTGFYQDEEEEQSRTICFDPFYGV